MILWDTEEHNNLKLNCIFSDNALMNLKWSETTSLFISTFLTNIYRKAPFWVSRMPKITKLIATPHLHLQATRTEKYIRWPTPLTSVETLVRNLKNPKYVRHPHWLNCHHSSSWIGQFALHIPLWYWTVPQSWIDPNVLGHDHPRGWDSS